jgi:hypothetical protein
MKAWDIKIRKQAILSRSDLKVALACSNNFHKIWRVKFRVKRLAGLVAMPWRQEMRTKYW